MAYHCGTELDPETVIRCERCRRYTKVGDAVTADDLVRCPGCRTPVHRATHANHPPGPEGDEPR